VEAIMTDSTTRPDAIGMLARSTATLVRPYDVTDLLAQLMRDAAEVAAADGAGLLLAREDGELEVLSATSHRAIELEIYQVQSGGGPCQDAVHEASVVTATSFEEIVERWPGFAEVARKAGVVSLRAVPLMWHHQAIGGLNLFWTSPSALSGEQEKLVQAFADVATLAIAHSTPMDGSALLTATRDALRGRNVIEQAKGVLAYQRDTEVAEAYDHLTRLADQRGVGLTEAALGVIADAQRVRPTAPRDGGAH
jgi:transcriptional regulator with GAF, ATPase, and Fis domain